MSVPVQKKKWADMVEETTNEAPVKGKRPQAWKRSDASSSQAVTSQVADSEKTAAAPAPVKGKRPQAWNKSKPSTFEAVTNQVAVSEKMEDEALISVEDGFQTAWQTKRRPMAVGSSSVSGEVSAAGASSDAIEVLFGGSTSQVQEARKTGELFFGYTSIPVRGDADDVQFLIKLGQKGWYLNDDQTVMFFSLGIQEEKVAVAAVSCTPDFGRDMTTFKHNTLTGKAPNIHVQANEQDFYQCGCTADVVSGILSEMMSSLRKVVQKAFDCHFRVIPAPGKTYHAVLNIYESSSPNIFTFASAICQVIYRSRFPAGKGVFVTKLKTGLQK